MSTKPIEFTIDLTSVEELKFTMHPELVPSDFKKEKVLVGFSNFVENNLKDGTLTFRFGITYMMDDKEVLESVCRFVFTFSEPIIVITFDSLLRHRMAFFLKEILPKMKEIISERIEGTILSDYISCDFDPFWLAENLKKIRDERLPKDVS